jgi:hypothetical protein
LRVIDGSADPAGDPLTQGSGNRCPFRPHGGAAESGKRAVWHAVWRSLQDWRKATLPRGQASCNRNFIRPVAAHLADEDGTEMIRYARDVRRPCET